MNKRNKKKDKFKAKKGFPYKKTTKQLESNPTK